MLTVNIVRSVSPYPHLVPPLLTADTPQYENHHKDHESVITHM